MDEKKFQQFKEALLSCRDCKQLFGYDPRPVFQGNPTCAILQISQAPSLKVSETGKPFHDQSGKKLITQWYQIEETDFYNPHLFYIASLGRCYPGKAKTGDKLPPARCSKKWLDKELEFVESNLIIIIGALAAKQYFKKRNFLELVMEDQILAGRKTYVLPHPSPLNIKWFMDHPEWQARLITVRNHVQQAIRDEKQRMDLEARQVDKKGL